MEARTQSGDTPDTVQTAGWSATAIGRILNVVMPEVGEEERRDLQAAIVLTWLAWPLLGAVCVISMWVLGIVLDASSLSAMLVPACLVPFAVIFSTGRFNAVLSSLGGAVAFMSMASPLVVLFTYTQCALSAPFPLIDHWLSQADAMIGFDWKRNLLWADSLARDYPAAEWVLRRSYDSIVAQVFAIIMVLSLTGQYRRLQSFVLTYVVSVVIVGVICLFLPAVGTYEYYGIDESMHPHLHLAVKNHHLADYLSLRAGTYDVFSITQGKGIVTFPSYHATLAVVFAWALWQTPYVRWIGLALNAMMLLATPLYGSHFLTDVIAGAALGPISFMIAGRIRNRARTWMGPIVFVFPFSRRGVPLRWLAAVDCLASPLRVRMRELTRDPGRAAQSDYVGGLIAMWLPVPFVIAFNVAAFRAAGIDYRIGGDFDLTYPMIMLLVAGMYTIHRFNPLASTLAHSLSYLLFMSGLLSAYTYAATALSAGTPLRDGLLHRADAILGFDWLTALHFVDGLAGSMPWLTTLADLAYASVPLQVLAFMAVMAATGSHARMQVLWLAFVLSLVAIGGIAASFPAVGTYEFHGVVDAMHLNLDLAVKSHHVEHYAALRDGSLTAFPPEQTLGIITFPSFHSTIAVVFMWGFWSVVPLRWPAVALNIAMLLATPFHGSHFLVDVIAGASMGILSICAALAMRKAAVSGVVAIARRTRSKEIPA